jgi:hypothetical protein
VRLEFYNHSQADYKEFGKLFQHLLLLIKYLRELVVALEVKDLKEHFAHECILIFLNITSQSHINL